MNTETAIQAMVNGTKVRATLANGRTVEGTIDAQWIMALTRFGWDRYLPANVPADAIKVGATLFEVRFHLSAADGRQLAITSTVEVEAGELEIAEPPAEEGVDTVAATGYAGTTSQGREQEMIATTATDTARRFTTEVVDQRFVITEVTGQLDRCGLPAGVSRELAWQRARQQANHVVVVELSGHRWYLGSAWDPKQFERAVYGGHVSYQLSMTDGHYAPEPFEAWVKGLRQDPERVVTYFNDAAPEVKEALPKYIEALMAVGLR